MQGKSGAARWSSLKITDPTIKTVCGTVEPGEGSQWVGRGTDKAEQKENGGRGAAHAGEQKVTQWSKESGYRK